MGGGGLAGFSLLLVYAAQYTTAVNLGIMHGVIPAVVMLLGWQLCNDFGASFQLW